jgi:type I restriction enzyme S subunit
MGSGTTPPSDSEDWYDGHVPWVTTGELRECEVLSTTKTVTDAALRKFSALRVYPRGSIVLAMYGATIGRLGVLGVEAATNQACCVLPASTIIDNKYLYYWLQGVRDDIINLASGGGQSNISQSVVASLRIGVPPTTSEQSQIAKFLDYETARIDALIEKQQQLIELLKEKRLAVISHAVTKGLNPDAPMRDSGVEWLGKVPAHWGVVAFKHVTSRIIVGIAEAATHAYAEQGVPIVRSTNIKTGIVDESDLLYLKPEFAATLQSKALRTDDVVITRTGANVGKSAVIPEALNNSQCFTLVIASLLSTANSHFYNQFINAAPGRHYIELTAWGSGQPNISVAIMQNMMTVLPPRVEQDAIVQFLDKESERYDILQRDVQCAVSLLTERRSALISAAVTGKIDVRNWKPPTFEGDSGPA